MSYQCAPCTNPEVTHLARSLGQKTEEGTQEDLPGRTSAHEAPQSLRHGELGVGLGFLLGDNGLGSSHGLGLLHEALLRVLLRHWQVLRQNALSLRGEGSKVLYTGSRLFNAFSSTSCKAHLN